MKLNRKPNIDTLNCAGDYCLTDNSPPRVIMACPLCAGVFACGHKIEQQEPLTLSPSVVGPVEAFTIPAGIDPHEQVRAPCGHHFWVKNGEAIDVS